MGMTLKALRANKGWTQADAAEKIGITKDTLSNYERGKYYPSVPIIQNIEQVFETNYSDIIFLPVKNAKSVK